MVELYVYTLRNDHKLCVSLLRRKEGSSFLRYLEIGNCFILCSFVATFVSSNDFSYDRAVFK